MFIKKLAWTKRNCCTIWFSLFHSTGQGSLTHPGQLEKQRVCIIESWKKPSLLVSQPAPPRGPNCWVPVHHGVSGGRPRWAADSRLTQGPRIVLAPNALFFFWDTHHATRQTHWKHWKDYDDQGWPSVLKSNHIHWTISFWAQYWLCNWPNKKRLTSICDVDVFLTTTPMLRLMLLLRMILPMVNWWRNIFN